MEKIEEIEATIASLSEEEYSHFRIWFYARDWEKWDREIETDSESGKLDFLLEDALTAKGKGNLKEI